MPINAKNILIGKKQEVDKKPLVKPNSIKASNIVVVNKPKEEPPVEEKVKTIKAGELIKKINMKSGYLRDILGL